MGWYPGGGGFVYAVKKTIGKANAEGSRLVNARNQKEPILLTSAQFIGKKAAASGGEGGEASSSNCREKGGTGKGG